MKKKRILIINEFSQLSTGFSTYMKYIIPLLHATGKYEIAEHATYCNKYHPLINTLPWKVYPNEPDQNNPQETNLYGQNRRANQFGFWRFDEICLDFKPDIVIDIRDPWMCLEWIHRSPFRKNFKFIHMPTCDGEPQKSEWIDLYKQCDRITTYSLWAKNLIEKQSGGQISVFGVTSPGADINEFAPLPDKVSTKKELGFPDNSFIIQTVMRNQPRKLYPDLFKAFVKFLEKCKTEGRDDLAQKTFLHCHTSFPDVGWDIPTELRRHGISHKVLFTYLCENCKSYHVCPFSGDIAVCTKCKNAADKLPNTVTGLDKKDLAKVMGCADLYIQYSICEGWGMPISDAKSCGVPVMAVDYSAMTEQCYNGGGIPIKINRMFQEPLNQTNQLRALPDIDDTASKMLAFFESSQDARNKLGQEARECMEKYYNWPIIAKVWEQALDTLDVPEQTSTWFSPPKMIKPNLNVPQNLNNEQFVDYCYRYIVEEPWMVNSIMAQKIIASLNLGYEPGVNEEGFPIKQPIDRNKVVQNLLNYVQQKNSFEQYRYDKLMGNINKTNRIIGVEI